MASAESTAAVWDYSVVSVHARHNDVLEEALKKQGREGWELVFVTEPVANEFRCILKRPAP